MSYYKDDTVKIVVIISSIVAVIALIIAFICILFEYKLYAEMC